MVSARFFDPGDIVRVSLNSVVGRGQQGEVRPAIVLSPRQFNALSTALVAPISQGGNCARIAGFTVPLVDSGTVTQGVVRVNAVRMLDLEQRSAKKVETAPADLVVEVLARLQTVMDGRSPSQAGSSPITSLRPNS